MDWKLLATTFAALFLAELGDKTQLAVIALTTQNRNPWPVLIGAASALVLVTVLGVVFGQAILQVIPETVLHRASAALFVVVGVLLWFRVL